MFVAFGVCFFDIQGVEHEVEFARGKVGHLIAGYATETTNAAIEVESGVPVKKPSHLDDAFHNDTAKLLPVKVVETVLLKEPLVELVLTTLGGI